MYEEYICNAARTMAETMKNADIPMYGSRLRLPDRKAIITLLKEMRQLMFPAYFGDPALMTLGRRTTPRCCWSGSKPVSPGRLRWRCPWKTRAAHPRSPARWWSSCPVFSSFC